MPGDQALKAFSPEVNVHVNGHNDCDFRINVELQCMKIAIKF